MQIVKDTPFEFGFQVFPLRPPRPSVTLVVKATFALTPGGPCRVAETQAPCTGDVHHDDDETHSVRYDTDFAPTKPHGECFVVGTCYAPGGGEVPVSGVAFKVGAVAKQIAVFGDRRWTGKLMFATLTPPVPFRTMPLRYERAFGGPGFAQNLYGVGIADVETPDGRYRPAPNLEDPQNLITSPRARPEPAGSFPIPRMARSRLEKAGTYDEAWKATRWPWLPADVDLSYFNAAPGDQQIEGYWRGDEEIVLRNLHPAHDLLRTRLPSLRARAFLQTNRGQGASFREVALHLDTITVDADADAVYCVWRGVAEVASEKLDDVERVFVTHEPLDARRTVDACRARMDQKLAEEAAEDAGFVPEEPPAPDAPAPGADPALAAGMARLAAVGIAAPAMPGVPSAPAMPGVPSAPAMPGVPAVPSAPAMPRVPAVPGARAPTPPSVPGGASAASAPATAAVPPGSVGTLPTQLAQVPPVEPRPQLREEIRARLARGESLAGEDLSGADLSRLDLRGVDFTGAILTRAKLTTAQLDNACFDGAVLAAADLTGASLREASLKHADLTQVTARAANFERATLDDAILIDAVLVAAVFQGASCARVEMARADAAHCNFRDARLPEADLAGATLEGATFVGAVLTDATLENVAASKVVMDASDLTKLRAAGGSFAEGSFRGATAPGSRWGAARLERANFAGANLERADFTAAVLARATFDGCNLRTARFLEARLVGASLLKADGFEGSFESADLSHADLRGANLFGAEFFRTKTDATRFELANLTRTKLA